MAIERNGNGNLPQELVVDILLRLPVKVLSLCKCVSKNWCSVIESTSFVRQHFESNQERLLIRLLKNQDQVGNVPAMDVDERVPEHEEPGHQEVPDDERYEDVYAFMIAQREAEYQEMIAEHEEDCRLEMLAKDGYKYALYVDGTFSEYEEPFHLQIPDEASDVFGPLNGVFCVVTQFPRGPMALVNPALRQFKPLPLVQWIDPANSFQYNELGMGLDPLTGDFKLVLIQYFFDVTMDDGDYTWVVSVCTSDSDSWRVLEDVGFINLSRRAHVSLCNTYMNGSYYWLLDFDDTTDVAILAFDMGTEKFREIKVTGDFAQSRSGFLALYRDSLALLMYDSAATCIDIWLMVTEGCWIKSSRVGPLEDIRWPLCLLKNNILFETMTALLTQCDVSTQELKTFEVRRMDHWSFSHWVYLYKESLVSIKGKTGKCKLWDTSSDLVKNFFKDSSSAQEPIAG